MRVTNSFCALSLATVVLACGAPERRPFRDLDSAPSLSAVDEHARQGAVVRDAIERGDLEAAHRSAKGLVLIGMREQPIPDSRLDAMVRSAQRVSVASRLEDAAHDYAYLAERCGECHVQFGGPASFAATPPTNAVDVVPRMRRHQWAAARLWEGLVAPSNDAWQSGATALADAPLGNELLPGRTAVPELDTLAQSVHELALRAQKAERTSARIELYGDLLATCASCHLRAGGGPR